MTRAVIITGTDTGIGKTVFSAALTAALDASYWKPVQSGLDGETDSQTVARLTGQPVLPEAYRLRRPASPHLAAAEEGLRIAPIALPAVEGPLVVEAAGGALVPLHGSYLYADQMARWQKPVIIVARTSLGTINHTLLTIEALRARHVPLLGVAFVGDAMADSQDAICRISGLQSLGRLPQLAILNREKLRLAAQALDLTSIRAVLS